MMITDEKKKPYEQQTMSHPETPRKSINDNPPIEIKNENSYRDDNSMKKVKLKKKGKSINTNSSQKQFNTSMYHMQ